MANLNDAMNEFRSVLAANLTGIGRVYERVPDSINDFPALIMWPNSGQGTIVSAQFGRTEHSIIVEIYQSAIEYTESIKTAELWESRMLEVMQEFHDLNGKIEHWVYPLEYRAGQLVFNLEQIYYGVQFRIRFKQNRSYSSI